MTFPEDEGFDRLSDREILLLTAQGLRNLSKNFDGYQVAQNGRCSNHGRRIELLESWRTGLVGAWTGLLAYMKFKGSAG